MPDQDATAAVERAVRAALPDRTVDQVEPQVARPGNATARVTFADAPPVYAKTATDTARRLAREVAATRYAAAHCAVGTPTVLAADPHAEPPYLVTEPLAGTPLNEPWTDGETGPSGDDARDGAGEGESDVDRDAAEGDRDGDGERDADGDRDHRVPLVRQAGAAIAGVHEATFDRAGVISGGDASGLDLVGDSWTDVLCRTVERRAADWFADRFTDLPPRLVETIRAVEPAVAGTPTLVHGDPSRINLHLGPTGLLDWERALVGDPAFGLVEAEFHLVEQPDVDEADRPGLRAALRDGYRERAGGLPDGFERRRPVYRAISYLLVPQTFEEWSSDVDRPDDELAAEVREEFAARLERARDATA